MTISALQATILFAFAVFAAVIGIYNLLQAFQTREQLIIRAEDMAADPTVLSDPLRRKDFFTRWAYRYDRSAIAAKLRERLRLACLDIKPSDYIVLRFGIAAGFVYIFWIVLKTSPFPAILVGLAIYFVGPRIVFAVRRDAYYKKFNGQLIEVTQSMANGLRAGMSIQQAINQVAERVPEPSRGEFRQVYNELQLGDNLAMVLNSLRHRIRSRDLDVLVNAVLVQHQAGGNLAHVLAAMSKILTERQRLMGEIQSMMAETRVSALVIQVLPLGMFVVLRNTPIGRGLFETTPGWIILAIYVVVQIGFYFLIRRIMRIEV